eukprot:scaffold1328_cov394-Prasinococcus_capsulatus_cf.AAC.50
MTIIAGASERGVAHACGFGWRCSAAGDGGNTCGGRAGFRLAAECARDTLEAATTNNQGSEKALRQDLLNVAKTTLCSKILAQDKDMFAVRRRCAVGAAVSVGADTPRRRPRAACRSWRGNLEAIQIIKKTGGTLTDSFLDEGFILEKKIGVGQPKRVENARILIANTAMDTDKVKIYGARVRVDGMAKVADIERAEKEKMKEKVEKILAHDINCFINRQLIYNYPEEIFADAGVMAIEHADFDGIERLALVTGWSITLDGAARGSRPTACRTLVRRPGAWALQVAPCLTLPVRRADVRSQAERSCRPSTIRSL